jgi:hypothetical protein
MHDDPLVLVCCALELARGPVEAFAHRLPALLDCPSESTCQRHVIRLRPKRFVGIRSPVLKLELRSVNPI